MAQNKISTVIINANFQKNIPLCINTLKYRKFICRVPLPHMQAKMKYSKSAVIGRLRVQCLVWAHMGGTWMIDVILSFFFSIPSVSKINKHILLWGLKNQLWNSDTLIRESNQGISPFMLSYKRKLKRNTIV